MPIVNPANVMYVDLYPVGKEPIKATVLQKTFSNAEAVYLFSFFAIEYIIGMAAFYLACRWGYKLFFVCDPETIHKAKQFIILLHQNWIALLFFIPFVFFRVIVIKLLSLREMPGAKFGSLKSISSLILGR